MDRYRLEGITQIKDIRFLPHHIGRGKKKQLAGYTMKIEINVKVAIEGEDLKETEIIHTETISASDFNKLRRIFKRDLDNDIKK